MASKKIFIVKKLTKSGKISAARLTKKRLQEMSFDDFVKATRMRDTLEAANPGQRWAVILEGQRNTTIYDWYP